MPELEQQVEQFKFSFTHSVEKLTEKLDKWFDALVTNVPNIILSIFIIIIFYYIGKLLGKLIEKLLVKRVKDHSIVNMTRKITHIIIFMMGVFLALVVMKLDTVLAGILTAAGIAGLAIGLALQNTLSNFFSGIVISFIPRVRLGDWIESNGFSGKITDINLRSVTIKGADNNTVVIPNSKVIDNPIKNYSLTKRSRVKLSCGIGYESDLAMVKELVEKTFADKFPQQGSEEIEFFYQEFGDSSINFLLRYWVPCKDAKDELHFISEGVLTIHQLFKAHHINIPFPIRTLEVRNQTPLDIRKRD